MMKVRRLEGGSGGSKQNSALLQGLVQDLSVAWQIWEHRSKSWGLKFFRLVGVTSCESLLKWLGKIGHHCALSLASWPHS